VNLTRYSHDDQGEAAPLRVRPPSSASLSGRARIRRLAHRDDRRKAALCLPSSPVEAAAHEDPLEKHHQLPKNGSERVVAVGVMILWYHYFRGLMMLGYVDSAIVRVRTISEAETQFARAHPNFGYNCALSELPRNEGIARVLVQGHIDNGYAFEIVGCEKTELTKPNSTYHVTARPLHSGQPSFCADPSGVLKSDESGSVERCIARGVPLGS
jgi:hypothetical protein